MGIPRIFHGHSMDIPWISLDIPWISIDIPLIFHAYSIDIPWIFHGYSMDIPCRFHLYSIDIPYLPYIFHICSIHMPYSIHSPRALHAYRRRRDQTAQSTKLDGVTPRGPPKVDPDKNSKITRRFGSGNFLSLWNRIKQWLRDGAKGAGKQASIFDTDTYPGFLNTPKTRTQIGRAHV